MGVSVKVPAGLHWRDARTAFAVLRHRGLKVGLTYEGSFSSVQGLEVVRLAPRTGSLIRPGGTIRIIARAEPISSLAGDTHSRYYRVPSFRDKTAATAVRWAAHHHVVWAIPDLPPLSPSTANSLLAAYKVLEQKPQPGSRISTCRPLPNGACKLMPLTLRVVPRA